MIGKSHEIHTQFLLEQASNYDWVTDLVRRGYKLISESDHQNLFYKLFRKERSNAG